MSSATFLFFFIFLKSLSSSSWSLEEFLLVLSLLRAAWARLGNGGTVETTDSRSVETDAVGKGLLVGKGLSAELVLEEE